MDVHQVDLRPAQIAQPLITIVAQDRCPHIPTEVEAEMQFGKFPDSRLHPAYRDVVEELIAQLKLGGLSRCEKRQHGHRHAVRCPQLATSRLIHF